MPKNAIKPSVFVEKMVIQANLFASYDYAGWVFELSIVSELRFWSQALFFDHFYGSGV